MSGLYQKRVAEIKRLLIRPTIDQMLALHKVLTGRDASPDDIAKAQDAHSPGASRHEHELG